MDSIQPEQDTSHYSVKAEDGYIDVVWTGRISKEMAADCVKEVYGAAKEVMDHDEPVRMRFSVKNAPELPNTDAFSEALRGLKIGIPFHRIVLWGTMPHGVRELASVLVDSFKGEFDIRYIESEQDALAWLLELPTANTTIHEPKQ